MRSIVAEEVQQRADGGRVAWRSITRLIAPVPAVVLVLCSLSADLVAIAGRDPIGLWQVLPAGPVAGDWMSAELSSTAFLLIGIALARRKRAGFWLALSMAAGALVVQGARLDHPISALTAALTAAILLATHRRYDVGTNRRFAKIGAGLALLGGLLVAASAALVAGGSDVGGFVADSVGSFVDLATPLAIPGMAAAGAAIALARLAYVTAAALALDPVEDQRPAEAIASAREALRRLGSGSLFPYQLQRPCLPFAAADGASVIAVATAGRTAVVLGDPAGDTEAGDRLLLSWADGCRRRDLTPVVYQASPGLVRRLRPAGWHALQIGRDAIVDPAAFDLGAPVVANLRHTVARARRGGLRTVWSPTGLAGLPGSGLAAGMADLDAAWLRRAGPRLGFTVGRFDPAISGPSAVVVALDPDDDVRAFIVLRPTGRDGGWMLDVMRRRRDGVPGAVETCLVAAIEGLAEMGVRRLSLGLAPLAGLDAVNGPLAERLLARAARLTRPLYDSEGLAFFKNKFGPTWEPRYLVVGQWWDVPAALLALLRLHLGGSWPRVVRSVVAGLAPAH